MLLQRLIASTVISSLFYLNNLDYIKIIPQNNIENVVLTRENKGIDHLIDNNKVIFFGEIHNEIDDKIKLEILIDHIRNIKKNDKLALGLEMVSSDKQIILNQFNNGEIDSNKLLELLNWDKTWNYLPEGYKLVFDNAKYNKINLVGLNSPEKVTNLFKKGLKFNKNYIDNDNLLSFIKGIRHFHSLQDKKVISEYYQINLLWETWIASEIENYLRIFPESKIIVYTGTQHSKINGIPKILDNLFDNKIKYINLTPHIDKDYYGEIFTKKNE